VLEAPDFTTSLGIGVRISFSILSDSHELHTAQEQQDVRGCKGQQSNL